MTIEIITMVTNMEVYYGYGICEKTDNPERS